MGNRHRQLLRKDVDQVPLEDYRDAFAFLHIVEQKNDLNLSDSDYIHNLKNSYIFGYELYRFTFSFVIATSTIIISIFSLLYFSDSCKINLYYCELISHAWPRNSNIQNDFIKYYVEQGGEDMSSSAFLISALSLTHYILTIWILYRVLIEIIRIDRVRVSMKQYNTVKKLILFFLPLIALGILALTAGISKSPSIFSPYYRDTETVILIKWVIETIDVYALLGGTLFLASSIRRFEIVA